MARFFYDELAAAVRAGILSHEQAVTEARCYEGWKAAEEAIIHRLPGHKDYSQGDTPWDDGWNARIEQEKRKSL